MLLSHPQAGALFGVVGYLHSSLLQACRIQRSVVRGYSTGLPVLWLPHGRLAVAQIRLDAETSSLANASPKPILWFWVMVMALSCVFLFSTQSPKNK